MDRKKAAKGKGPRVELMLEEEMTEHLGYEPHQRQSAEDESSPRRENTRNGYTRKQLKTSEGASEIRVPRDREATFEPKVVRKRCRLSHDMERRIVAMYASGMITRDIREHVREMWYGHDVSEVFVSRVVERLDPSWRPGAAGRCDRTIRWCSSTRCT